MIKVFKNILKKTGLYYFLQGSYRQIIFYCTLLLNRIKYSKYKGSGFTCNFCNHQYKRFAPRYSSGEDRIALEKYHVISGDGENVYCPYCMSTSRERLILQKLKDNIDYNGKRILHLSPEKKIFDFLKKDSYIITADIEPGFYKLIDKNVVYADATALPFANETFDIVIGNHIMEHIADDSKAMQEIYRVLKHKGKAIVQIPFSPSISATIEQPLICDPKKQSELFGQKDHVRIYNIKDYINLLMNAGFKATYKTSNSAETVNCYAFQQDEGFIDCVKE